MQIESPAALVAVIVAAHRTGDRDLELAASNELLQKFNVKLTFASEPSKKIKSTSRRLGGSE